jgi:hypothetical protein
VTVTREGVFFTISWIYSYAGVFRFICARICYAQGNSVTICEDLYTYT